MNFNYQRELQKMIESKKLTQVYFHGSIHEFTVAYLIDASHGFLTLVEINDIGALDGVTIRRVDDVDVIKTETLYLKELSKHIKQPALDESAQKNLKGIKNFTFDGFISALDNTDTIVEILDQDGNGFVGRIVQHDEQVLVLDEYSAQKDQLIARSYINREIIARIAIDIPYLRIITQSLTDKKL